MLWPRSHCRQCKHPIPLRENVPVLSYIFLGGKCSTCHSPIPVTSPLVEILTGGLLVAVLWHCGFSLSFLHYSILILFLLPISFIDLDTNLILNILTFPGMLAGLLLSFVVGHVAPLQAMLGLILGGGFLFLVRLLGAFLFEREGMGAGDVKLGAMIGVFLGPKVVVALVLAFFLAVPVIAVGFSMKKLHSGSKLPFGPFISLGAVILIYFGPTPFTYYFELVRDL